MSWECPECKSLNEDAYVRCLCGYEQSTGNARPDESWSRHKDYRGGPASSFHAGGPASSTNHREVAPCGQSKNHLMKE
jgi:hypothetical protein